MQELSLPEITRKSREQALKLTKHGSLEGRYPVRIDNRTVVYRKVKNNQ